MSLGDLMRASNERRENDLRMLQALLDAGPEHFGAGEYGAFDSMLGRLQNGQNTLTPKQREWVTKATIRLGLDEPEPAENLVSRGLVPRGNEVPVPEVLKNLPLKPPGRR